MKLNQSSGAPEKKCRFLLKLYHLINSKLNHRTIRFPSESLAKVPVVPKLLCDHRSFEIAIFHCNDNFENVSLCEIVRTTFFKFIAINIGFGNISLFNFYLFVVPFFLQPFVLRFSTYGFSSELILFNF